MEAVYDATAQSNCRLAYNHGPLVACPTGTVINESPMTELQARQAGYAYVVETGDGQQDKAAIKQLREKVRKDGRTRAVAAAEGTMTAMTAMSGGPCNSTAHAYLQYTATNAPSPQPEIGVDIDYTYIGGGSTCYGINVTYSNTFFAAGTSSGSTWYDYTSFNLQSDDPGCYYGLPHGATSILNGQSRQSFGDGVEHGCGSFVNRSSGSIDLNYSGLQSDWPAGTLGR